VRKSITLVIALFLMVSGLLAQSGSDSVELSSFRKGRNLVGLSGSISSSYLNNASVSNDNSQLGNLYRFDIKLGKFVADKNLVGLFFIASRTQMIGLSYVMNDRVSFDVGFEYSQSRYWGKISNNSTNETNDIVLDRGGFVFSFGFNVLFERLKKDD
jgi:hypothetical protein